MTAAYWAREIPRARAIASPHGTLRHDELNAQANQLARSLQARGLRPGDAMALVCSNRPEFAVTFCAAVRSGLRLTTINWHLTADEIAYILDDCEAKALVGDARFGDAVAGAAEAVPAVTARLAVGGEIQGFEPFDEVLAEQSGSDIEAPVLGKTMLYTSGTTGRPKGVNRKDLNGRIPPSTIEIAKIAAFQPGRDVSLCTGPLYHAAPLAFSLTGPLTAGVTVVLMDGWDAAETLSLIEEHGVTHSHMVPTMFHRLLSLPEEVRTRHDLSTLRVVLHGAAPCPVHVKRDLMDWLGPIVYEYYAATEGWGSFVTPEVWLERPGTVGQPEPGHVSIRDEEGRELPAGEIGAVYLRSPDEGRFEYFKDDAKTRKAFDETGAYFTLGDMGCLDEDGYLFLRDRSADLIISGGVNIYPAEVDAVLLTHPAVGDAATIGIPNEDWGEEVRSVVELRAGVTASDALARELVDYCRERMAHYKCPKAVDFSEALPRHDTGKIYRRMVREPYWAGRASKI